MSAHAKIKKQAAQLEHDRQYDKSLALYARLLEETPDDEVDVAVFNRAGDVAFRAGDAARAITYYERALDLYAAGGLLNNAIALGAKILRQAPERAATHYTLGVLHAKKGFRSDARQHFLIYAERMQRGGQGAEAARSLADYVVVCDGATDARAGLATHLATGGPRPAAVGATLAELLEQALRAAGQITEPGDDGVGDGRAGSAARGGDAFASALVFIDLDAAALEMDDAAAAPVDAPEPTATQRFAPAEAPVATPLLRTLPGELPPLAPSMVALEIGDAVDAADEAFLPSSADAYQDGLLDLDDAPAGVPAFPEGALDLDEHPAHGSAGELALHTGTSTLDPDDGLLLLDETPTEPQPTDWVSTPAALAPTVTAPALLDLDDEILEGAPPAPPALPSTARPAPRAAMPAVVDDAVDLGDWLREQEPAPSTRLVAPTLATTGDEEADFQATLQAFKAGIARSLADADFDAHYDLGVAYREMGLLDEAIGEFQKAARTPDRPLRALEALAGCFLESGQPELVLSTLAGVGPALADGATVAAAEAPSHVALCYLLGAASQEVGRVDDARRWFLRVLAIDYAFRDAAVRLASLSPPTR